ncbi:GAF and HD-GYP domain-containing protein [Psychrosphaera haliotis]|uniref:HD domain-containing protein n=1 Tax=Psychrosphaera haliotis TaxID=555083 RepID=A0A6N8FCX7_9GAMM|nr:HD family phosphohydrolase [Psychrosphaera haliotis]MUH72592.1 HD domain-containing protein [Psychrosphaera haliotis]
MAQHKITNSYALQQLVDISIKLSSESDSSKLLDEILQIVMSIANCDAGSIYSITPEKHLKFETVINRTLDIYLGGGSAKTLEFSDIPLFIDGSPNKNAMVAHSANSGEVINIPDVYAAIPFDVSAARKMDEATGYRTQSMLVIPLKDHTGDIIGVIQLINALEDGQTVEFSNDVETLVRSFASLGAISLTNTALVQEMEQLFSAFARTIAKAIDEKSPHTGGHCRRVPALTLMLAEEIHKERRGPLADFTMTDADRHEIDIAGWLHDCGKIATPDHIIEKSKKLQTIFDRIEFVNAKFEIVAKDIEIAYQSKIINALQKGNTIEVQQLKTSMDRELKQLKLDRSFIQKVNVGGEYLSDQDIESIDQVSKSYQLAIEGVVTSVLNVNEVENLKIRRGTLTDAEKEIMKNHMVITMDILETLPFPKHLQNVTEYALGHHETMDGKGYPRGLTKEQMSVPARLMALADIFEALSAADRPYKSAKPVSECLKIMGSLVENNHLDSDIFAIFVESRVYEKYIREFASTDQLDPFDIYELPGYQPIE